MRRRGGAELWQSGYANQKFPFSAQTEKPALQAFSAGAPQLRIFNQESGDPWTEVWPEGDIPADWANCPAVELVAPAPGKI